MCLMHTDLPGAGRAQDHRDLVVRQAEVQAVQDAVAAERLDDVDELDGVLRAVLARAAGVPLVLVGLGLRAALVRHLAVLVAAPPPALCGATPAAPRLDRGVLAPRPAASAPRVSSQSRGVQRLRVRFLVPALLAHCLPHPPIGALGFEPQKIWVPTIPTRWTMTVFNTIDFAVAVPTPTGPAARVVAVVTPHKHDHRGHRHALNQAVEQVGWVLEHPEDQEEAAGRHLPDLLHHRQVAREEAGADRRDVHERQHHPGGEQARRAQEDERVDAHHLERVDLVRDAHGADLGHEAGADLRRHHVAEGVGHDLAQVAPGAEDARVRGGAHRAVEVRALDPALEAEDEREAPDHERRAEDQDAGLAQRLAEEVEARAR